MQTLRKGLKILALISHAPRGLNVEELARSTGMKRRILYLYLKTLEAEHYVAQDPETRRYVAYYPHPGFPLPTESFKDPAFFQELAETTFALTGYRAYVVTVRPWGLHLEASAGKSGQPVRLDPGGRGPLSAYAHAFSAGQAILAYLPSLALWAHLARFPLKPFTHRTLTSLDALEARLREVRAQGFAPSRGELTLKRCGLAVPLRAPSGHILGALAIGLPLRKVCAFEAPETPRACRACLTLAPALRVLTEEVWRSSAT